MEILIPTDDGLTIAPEYEKATSFRFLILVNGVIQEDTMQVTDTIKKKPSLPQIVLTRGITPETENNLSRNDYEVIHTTETNIFNALTSYLKNQARMESNYCCCP